MKSLWKLQEESKSFLYKVNVWCLWLRGQKIHKSVRCYHFWFVIAANAKSKQSDLSLIKCFLFRYSYYLTIETAVLQGGKLIYLKCVCVCLCASTCVYIYNYPSFSPVKLMELETLNMGTQGLLFWAQLRKLCFVPLHAPVFDLRLKISEPLPPIQKQINTERKKPLPSQHIGPPRLKNERGCKSSDEPVWTTDSNKYLSRWRSLRALQRSSDSTECLGSHRPLYLKTIPAKLLCTYNWRAAGKEDSD